ncbi:hybrid sensor histidine kinase/response regulator [Paraliomyxa miuraensis]|uniref:hybrid sensor histidine kinase/response regulator n=1 Tax=Paraliomyxa miuraensis TaxID=376150 RepID=UPI0022540655|nr:response regulator [Paraliomyxa miuraensis]MCX4241506.1 response regulator [Paraliomyxa miuraensis]
MAPRENYRRYDSVEEHTRTSMHRFPIDPRAEAADCLVILAGDDPGRRIYLEGDVVLGRGKDCDAIVSDQGISRRHALVGRNTDGHYYVRDLDSRNGVRVNGHRVKEAVLEFGDEIALGEQTVLALARRERFEDHLLVAQKMQALGQLAGGVAHDFNNILGALFANVTFLGTKHHDTETAQCLEEMEAAVRRAIDLTRQLSGFGRRTTSEHRSIRLHELIREGVDLLRRTLPRNVAITTEIPDDLLVIGDTSRLLQVAMNLCINAKDAMPRGGTLTISADAVEVTQETKQLQPGPYVRVTFADTGLGIDPVTLARIFEPFFTTKPRGQGTGLGLATVQAILRDHNGSIEARSEVGKGTEFIIHLPSAESARESTFVGPRPELSMSGGITGLVLVADDDPLVRTAITRVLSRDGADVVTATDGAEALRRYAERAAELRLIVLDLDMPRIDGAEVLKVLRSFECDLPVVIVSGHTDPARTKEVKALGISEFLPKPFDARSLLGAVKRHLRRQ